MGGVESAASPCEGLLMAHSSLASPPPARHESNPLPSLMKTYRLLLRSLLATAALLLASTGLTAQTLSPTAPDLSGVYGKLFGETQAFSAQLILSSGAGSDAVRMEGTLRFDHGSTRVDMDLKNMQGPGIDPAAMEQMEAMGMTQLATINRAGAKQALLYYPNLNAGIQMPIPQFENKPNKPVEVTVERIGPETVQGQACIKSRTIITGSDGIAHTALVWIPTTKRETRLS